MKSRLLVLCLFLMPLWSEAKILVEIGKPYPKSKKIIVKVTVRNIFTQPVDNARATLIVTDGSGKVVGQLTQTVIGTQNHPNLKPGKSAVVPFAFPSDLSFKKAKIVFSKIVLTGGKVVDLEKEVEIMNP